MDINLIKEKLKNIKNPVTSKTLEAEARFEKIEVVGDKLEIKYKRDGISPQDKRLIEKFILESLSSLVPEDKITIQTSSDHSQDVFKAIPTSTAKENPTTGPAQLKTGHGTIGNKKAVPGVGKVLAIGSGKGGVGKSTFTVNLALSLSRMGKKVGIIDADIYGPSVPMLLNKRLDKPMANSEKKIIPIESHGISFMSFGLFINENEPVIWRGPMLGGVLNQFLFDVDWNGYDYVLIDLPPGTGDVQLSMVQNVIVDGTIIISTPQDVALLDAKKGLEMFRKLNLPIVGMVENMSSFVCTTCNTNHHLFGHSGVANAVDEIGVPFLGAIPLEIELRIGSDEGNPYMAQNKLEGRPVWKAYESIAEKVNYFFNPQNAPAEKKGVLSRLFGK
jgi:ATP-binding protein involved in chromosome partitioning